MSEQNFILTLSCMDQPGIVAAVTAELFNQGGNISESNQYWDRGTNRFFMRIAFAADAAAKKRDIEAGLSRVMERFDIKFQIIDASLKPKIIIMVSKFDHAMLHLLYQIRVGWLNADVVAIVSNHEDSRRTAEH